MFRRTIAGLAGLTCCSLAVAHAAGAIRADEAARLSSAAQVAQEVRTMVPADYWDRARCVAVIPDLKKAAFIIGGEYGKGVLSCRSGEGWSAPLFLELAKGSWGFQAGAEQIDLVLLVMNEAGVQKMLKNQVNLGADIAAAAGPVGRAGQVSTDAQLKAEIVSYSRAQGLFAGINLSGGVLRADDEANRSVYGPGATASTILATRGISAPTEASAFITALGGGRRVAAAPAPASTTTASSTAGAPANASTPLGSTVPDVLPTTDSDVRTQVVAMRQAVEQLLSQGAASPDAPDRSGGRNADGTVTISRARLEQLRNQIDALLMTLDKR